MASHLKMPEDYHVTAARYHLDVLVTSDDWAANAKSKVAKEIHQKASDVHRKLYERHAKNAAILRNERKS